MQEQETPARPTVTEDAVDLSDVRFAWADARRFQLVVDRLVVGRGERLLLVGPSGVGKSTLLSLICGIVLPLAGQVRVLGQDLARLNGPRRDRFRAEHIGIIFQMFNLLPYGSVLDNVLLPLSFAPQRRARVARGGGTRQEAQRLLEALDLDADLLSAATAELSVGQQQRVAAARALIGGPEIVVADEPTSALDPARQTDFLDLLFAQVAAAGATLIMVSHEPGMARWFDRVQQLDDLLRTDGAP